jgi:uncharacterized protein
VRQKINMIALGVDDIERAVAFYEKGLGWKRAPISHNDFIVFDMGGIGLALYPRNLLAEDAEVKNEPT